MTIRGWAVGFAVALTIGRSAADAQQPQRPPPYAERVDVSSIVVDVRVIDEFGLPILGLSAADFFVTIGGKPVKVQSSVWTGGSPAAASEPQSVAGRTAAMPSPETGQLVVLLFQKSLIHERARGFVRMVEQSRSLVRELRPSDRMAILMFDHSLTIWSDFTSDRATLDRILARGLLHERAPTTVEAGSPSLLGALNIASARKVSTMEGAFALVADALRPLPGSKAITYVGYGMGGTGFGVRQDTGPPEVHAPFGALAQDLASNGHMNNEYQRAWRSLTAARVSVFSVDISQADTHSLATSMQVIAADTGGFYASSLDFPEKPMRFVAGALNGHYVLFVEPPAEPADRTIAVGVTASRRASVFATSSYRAPEK